MRGVRIFKANVPQTNHSPSRILQEKTFYGKENKSFAYVIALQKTKADSPKSWSVATSTIDPKTVDLSVKNPNGGEEIAHRSPQAIMEEIAALDAESAEVLGNIKALL